MADLAFLIERPHTEAARSEVLRPEYQEQDNVSEEGK